MQSIAEVKSSNSVVYDLTWDDIKGVPDIYQTESGYTIIILSSGWSPDGRGLFLSRAGDIESLSPTAWIDCRFRKLVGTEVTLTFKS